MARFDKTYCSQCGGEFGPGDEGFSHCEDHAGQINRDDDESPAELALRSLACWLGAGGYNAPTVDAKVFEEKIRWGVQQHGKEWALANNIAARELAEQVMAMDFVTAKGLRAKHLARTILGIKTADESADKGVV